MQIGSHDAPIKDVAHVFQPNGMMQVNFVITGGWDAQVKFWQWQGNNQLAP